MKAWVPLALYLKSVALPDRSPVYAQFTSESLQQKYPQAADGSFVVEPGVTIKAIYGDRQQACVLTIFGAISAGELQKVFAEVVPAKSRGRKKLELRECTGGCVQLIDFKKLNFASGLVGTQSSDPDAIITFKRRDCKTAVSEARNIPLNIEGVHR